MAKNETCPNCGKAAKLWKDTIDGLGSLGRSIGRGPDKRIIGVSCEGCGQFAILQRVVVERNKNKAVAEKLREAIATWKPHGDKTIPLFAWNVDPFDGSDVPEDHVEIIYLV